MAPRSEVIALDVLDDGAALARFNADLLAGSGADFTVKVEMTWKTKGSVPGEGAVVEGVFEHGMLRVEYDPSRVPVQGELDWDNDRPRGLE